jgi:hypothetical protein
MARQDSTPKSPPSVRATKEAIRTSILNPAKLSSDRQIEICIACHLESTSCPLPKAVQRYERGPFSFRACEPLGDFILNFDHAPNTGHDDKGSVANLKMIRRDSVSSSD